jgi:hypothetical protein
MNHKKGAGSKALCSQLQSTADHPDMQPILLSLRPQLRVIENNFLEGLF